MKILRVTDADLALIDRAVGELCLPYKETPALNDMVKRLNEQIQAQTAPRPVVKAAAELQGSIEMPLANGHIGEVAANGAAPPMPNEATA